MKHTDVSIVIDVGNTTTHFGVCRDKRIRFHFRVPSLDTALKDEAAPILKKQLKGATPSGIMISSVVPGLARSIRLTCKSLGARPVWLTHEIPTGITLRYKKPEEIGPDRIANVVAAEALIGTPAIVVDIGTAITFDCVARGGTYLGGIIAPGPKLTRTALAEKTGLLPFVDIKVPCSLIGRSTVEAIQSGMIFGTRELIEGILRLLRKEMGGRPRVIFTGGQRAVIVRGWKHAGQVEPLLTLEGLRIIHERLKNSRRLPGMT
jgi:type III pantothenate kinase